MDQKWIIPGIERMVIHDCKELGVWGPSHKFFRPPQRRFQAVFRLDSARKPPRRTPLSTWTPFWVILWPRWIKVDHFGSGPCTPSRGARRGCRWPGRTGIHTRDARGLQKGADLHFGQEYGHLSHSGVHLQQCHTHAVHATTIHSHPPPPT